MGAAVILPGELWQVTAVNSQVATLTMHGTRIVATIIARDWKEKGTWLRARKPKKK